MYRIGNEYQLVKTVYYWFDYDHDNLLPDGSPSADNESTIAMIDDVNVTLDEARALVEEIDAMMCE